MKKFYIITLLLVITSCGGNISLQPASSFLLTSSGNNLYVLSRQWGIVTKIDMNTLGLTTYSVGAGASMILPYKPLVFGTATGTSNITSPSGGVAVLNPSEDTVYLIGNSVVKKTIADNLNDMVISPDGTHAVVYHNYIPGEEANFRGILVFNTFSVVNLTTTTDDTTTLSIGGGAPQEVVFTPLGDKFIVISNNRCFVVPTAYPTNSHYIELWPDPSIIVVPDQVVITPQGDIALIRSYAENAVYAINLLVPSIMNVFTENQPTWVSIYPDGNIGLIVDQGTNSVSILSFDHSSITISEVAVSLTTPASAVAMSSSCTGGMCTVSDTTYSALLYAPSSSSMSITYLKIKNGIISTTVYGGLIAPVQSILFAPDDPAKAVILHRASSLPNAAYPVSLIDVDSQDVNPFYIKEAPSSVVFTRNQEGDEFLWMTLNSQNELVYYDLTSGLSGFLTIPSMPDTMGVSNNTLFISHDQPLGFITLLDINSLNMRFVSGFNVYKLFDR
jgi:hypothetical protein